MGGRAEIVPAGVTPDPVPAKIPLMAREAGSRQGRGEVGSSARASRRAACWSCRAHWLAAAVGAAVALTLAFDAAAQTTGDRDSATPTATLPPTPAPAGAEDAFDPGPRTANPPAAGSPQPPPPPPGRQVPPPYPYPPRDQAPPPGYGYPPPGYAYPPPGYGYPPSYGYPPPGYVFVPMDNRPLELEVREGRSPPPGYYEKSTIRKGLVIPGAIVFGVTYGLSFLIGTMGSDDDNSDLYLLVPVAGPIIWGHSKKCDEYGGNCGSPTLGWMLGIGQAVGITLFYFGVTKRDKVWRREEIQHGSVTLSPMLVGRRTPGFALTGRL